MNDLKWKKPTLEDTEFIYNLTNSCKSMSCDTSYANLFLLRDKYDIEIAFYKDFLLRRYNGSGSRNGYCFPLGKGFLPDALTLLQQDAKENDRNFSFCLLSEAQTEQLAYLYPDRFLFTENRDDSDYIYLQSSLALLKGKKYHKKKNHVSQFERKWSSHHYCEINPGNVDDAWRVATEWLYERFPNVNHRKSPELNAIHEALSCFEQLKLRGCILYVDARPVGMTIASAISASTCDIHFEKVLKTYAAGGAYAAINQHFSASLADFTYINREEDIGIPGLREAKLSYHPDILSAKYMAIARSTQP